MNDGKGSSVPRKKDEDGAAAAELSVDNGGRTATARMELYVKSSACIQLDIGVVGGLLVGPGVR